MVSPSRSSAPYLSQAASAMVVFPAPESPISHTTLLPMIEPVAGDSRWSFNSDSGPKYRSTWCCMRPRSMDSALHRLNHTPRVRNEGQDEPPAASTTAWAAAMSQHEVGPNRGYRSAEPSATMHALRDEPILTSSCSPSSFANFSSLSARWLPLATSRVWVSVCFYRDF